MGGTDNPAEQRFNEDQVSVQKTYGFEIDPVDGCTFITLLSQGEDGPFNNIFTEARKSKNPTQYLDIAIQDIGYVFELDLFQTTQTLEGINSISGETVISYQARSDSEFGMISIYLGKVRFPWHNDLIIEL